MVGSCVIFSQFFMKKGRRPVLVGAVVLLASKGLLLELKSALRLVRVAIWGEGSRAKMLVL
jgi:hypothetical protein